jgi:hypothetical protein
MRDASTTGYVESNYGGKKDSYQGGSNCEVSTRLTLVRRPGLSIYNSQTFPPISRFYGWNTFTLADEAVRVMADTATAVYDATSNSARPNTKELIFTKSAAAQDGKHPTYFLGVGNTLYMTNGVDNVQVANATNKVTKWGVDGPANAPQVSQQAITNPYGVWKANTAMGAYYAGMVLIYDPNGNTMQFANLNGVTGPAPGPTNFGLTFGAITPDNTTQWFCCGAPADWQANRYYNAEDALHANVAVTTGQQAMMFVIYTAGTSGATPPPWTSAVGSFVTDGSAVWINVGVQHEWKDIGPGITIQTGSNNPVNAGYQILDPSGYVQTVLQSGVTGPIPPNFSTANGALTLDGSVIWGNTGAYSVAATAPRQYGYAFMDSTTIDISNMSPKSAAISVIANNQVVVQGEGPTDAQDDTIILYRTAAGGSTFFELTRFPATLNTAWSFNDNLPDSALNTELQAQVGGEGTPLPSGATCLAYHLGRIFAAVNNVVYVSSGPDAIVSGSSGNAGFDTTFTAQSKIIRFWVISLGVVVLTLRDAYIIQGSGTSTDPLYMTTWLENLPLLHYDAFTTLLSSAYLFGGQRMVQSLDPGSGVTEASFPIAPLSNQIDPAKAYLTMHVGGSGETALYLSDGTTLWYRMAPTSAPESGANWSPAALISGGMSALQSVEILPGTMVLMVGPATAGGPIRVRDTNTHSDAGTPYPMTVDYNPIVLANPGQMAGLAWMAIKSNAAGTAPTLGVLLDEIQGTYEPVPRTRQDPTNLTPSTTYLSNRHSLLQNQKPVWCQVIKFGLQWEAIDSPDELLTYTIFGQTWQEQRSQ